MLSLDTFMTELDLGTIAIPEGELSNSLTVLDKFNPRIFKRQVHRASHHTGRQDHPNYWLYHLFLILFFADHLSADLVDPTALKLFHH